MLDLNSDKSLFLMVWATLIILFGDNLCIRKMLLKFAGMKPRNHANLLLKGRDKLSLSLMCIMILVELILVFHFLFSLLVVYVTAEVMDSCQEDDNDEHAVRCSMDSCFWLQKKQLILLK